MPRIILRPSETELRVFKLIFKLSHTFCEECINSWLNSVHSAKEKLCPICRNKVTKTGMSRDLIAFNIINDMEVYCNNKGLSFILFLYFTIIIKPICFVKQQHKNFFHRFIFFNKKLTIQAVHGKGF
jgi:hypothetical protein